MLQSFETLMSSFLEVPDMVYKFTFHLEMSLLSRLLKAPSTGTSAAFAIKVYCWIFLSMCFTNHQTFWYLYFFLGHIQFNTFESILWSKFFQELLWST